MLHEVLLALSGHPSPLFIENGQQPDKELFALLSQSEKALLKSTGDLANHHRKLRHLIQHVASKYASIICRAVATSIQQTHLARFQKMILDVESSILTKDTKIVGAYDIVPLAAVAGKFDGWHRLMKWFWDMTCFMQPASSSTGEPKGHSRATGAMLINKLRAEADTGFPEIQEAATALSKVAETAWLRQLSGWLLYGKLPAYGAQDFFIKAVALDEGESTHFRKDRELLPSFVTPATANTIVFIGKSLDQVKKHAGKGGAVARPSAWNEAELASAHLANLSALPLPLQPAQLSRALSAIKLSLSQNVLQHLLPMRDTLTLLDCFRQYFLLGRGEFAVALVDEAERRLAARQQSMGRLLQQDPIKALQGLSIKDAELQEALNYALKALAREDENGEDMTLDFATKYTSLSGFASAQSRPSTSDSVSAKTPQVSPVAFSDILFPSRAWLQINIESPLDLFISPEEASTYSSINAYLVAIRRAQVRIADLWRRTAARRHHPSPSGRNGKVMQAEAKERDRKRVKDTRKVWATCSAANFLVSETAAYFEGEIIRESCDVFEAWVKAPSSDEADTSVASLKSEQPADTVRQRDPETLAAGHRSFLASLTYALLLTDIHYSRELRSLLGNLDALIAFFNRLLDLQQKLDLESEAGFASPNTEEQEQRTSLELDRARKKVDSDLKSVVSRLRQLDHERIGSGRYFDLGLAESGGFEPWKGGGVDRLLMKLEFGRMTVEASDLI